MTPLKDLVTDKPVCHGYPEIKKKWIARFYQPRVNLIHDRLIIGPIEVIVDSRPWFVHSTDYPDKPDPNFPSNLNLSIPLDLIDIQKNLAITLPKGEIPIICEHSTFGCGRIVLECKIGESTIEAWDLRDLETAPLITLGDVLPRVYRSYESKTHRKVALTYTVHDYWKKGMKETKKIKETWYSMDEDRIVDEDFFKELQEELKSEESQNKMVDETLMQLERKIKLTETQEEHDKRLESKPVEQDDKKLTQIKLESVNSHIQKLEQYKKELEGELKDALPEEEVKSFNWLGECEIIYDGILGGYANKYHQFSIKDHPFQSKLTTACDKNIYQGLFGGYFEEKETCNKNVYALDKDWYIVSTSGSKLIRFYVKPNKIIEFLDLVKSKGAKVSIDDMKKEEQRVVSQITGHNCNFGNPDIPDGGYLQSLSWLQGDLTLITGHSPSNYSLRIENMPKQAKALVETSNQKGKTVFVMGNKDIPKDKRIKLGPDHFYTNSSSLLIDFIDNLRIVAPKVGKINLPKKAVDMHKLVEAVKNFNI